MPSINLLLEEVGTPQKRAKPVIEELDPPSCIAIWNTLK